MKKQLLLIFLLSFISNLFSQARNPIATGEVTIVTNQTMKFSNLRFIDNQVAFFNTETKSEFTYFLNSIKSIDDGDGMNVYLKEGELLPVKPVPGVDWTNGNVPLRNEKKSICTNYI